MSEVIILQLSRSDLDGMIRDAVDSVAKRPISPVMTKKQLAVYVDQPISTINRWMKQGLPFYKVDETSYPEFYKPQVDAWLERRFNERVQKVQGQEDYGQTQGLEQGNVVRLEAGKRANRS